MLATQRVFDTAFRFHVVNLQVYKELMVTFVLGSISLRSILLMKFSFETMSLDMVAVWHPGVGFLCHVNW